MGTGKARGVVMRTKVFGSLSGINLQHSTKKKTQQPTNRQQETFSPTRSHGLVVSSFEMTKRRRSFSLSFFVCVTNVCLIAVNKQAPLFVPEHHIH